MRCHFRLNQFEQGLLLRGDVDKDHVFSLCLPEPVERGLSLPLCMVQRIEKLQCPYCHGQADPPKQVSASCCQKDDLRCIRYFTHSLSPFCFWGSASAEGRDNAPVPLPELPARFSYKSAVRYHRDLPGFSISSSHASPRWLLWSSAFCRPRSFPPPARPIVRVFGSYS